MIDPFLQYNPDSLSEGPLKTKEYIELTIQALIAIGTLLLAIIAVYGERVKRWLFRPHLDTTVGDSPPYVEKIGEPRTSTGGAPTPVSAVIKMRVSNSGSSSAQLCKGLIQKIFCTRAASDTFFELRALSPSALYWNNDKDEFTISPKIPSYLEVARIEKAEAPSLDTGATASPASEYVLFVAIEEPGIKGRLIRLGKGRFIIPVILIADNIRNPITVFVDIFWNGTDPNSMNSSNFYVKLLSSHEVPKEARVAI